MTVWKRYAAALLVLAGCAAARAEVPQLKSPWDAKTITLTEQRYYCSLPITVAHDLQDAPVVGSTQLGNEENLIVKANSPAAAKYLTLQIVHAADAYRKTGSHAAARCVYERLDNAARSLAMTGKIADDNSWQQMARSTYAFTVAMLKVRGSGVGTPAQEKLIDSWLVILADVAREHYIAVENQQAQQACSSVEGGSYGDPPVFDAYSGPNGGDNDPSPPPPTKCKTTHDDLRSHRGLEVAMAQSALGILTNDRKRYEWGLKVYRAAVDHIDKHGMLVYDITGKWTAKFNIESTGQLVQIAELAMANGDDLYAYKDGALHRMVRVAVNGVVDPGIYSHAANSAQTMPRQPARWEIAWATAYNKRFPNPQVTQLIAQLGPSDVLWGGRLM